MSLLSFILNTFLFLKLSLFIAASLLSGCCFGLCYQTLYAKKRDIKTFVFFSLLASSLSSLSQQLALKSDILIEPTLLISGFILSVSIWMAAFYIKAGKKFEFSEAVFIMLAVVNALIIGMGLWIAALLILFVIGISILIYSTFFPIELRAKEYIAHIEVLQISTVESIEKLLHNFDILVIEKQFIRKKNIIIILRYTTSPLIQHLLVKKLFYLSGLGDIVFL
jgi:hypothetical protein